MTETEIEKDKQKLNNTRQESKQAITFVGVGEELKGY